MRSKDIIKELKISLEVEFKNYQHIVNNNVAIAAAITSYSRIHIMDFKLNNDTIYSDTDSIILGNSINSFLIGPELGQMKDELNGEYMTECYVLGIKNTVIIINLKIKLKNVQYLREYPETQ